jgi:hypothetical protein
MKEKLTIADASPVYTAARKFYMGLAIETYNYVPLAVFYTFVAVDVVCVERLGIPNESSHTFPQ